jgi:hypothetical protein
VIIETCHRSLLRACLASGANFETELRKWEQSVHIDDIDYATMRLIPYLYRKSLEHQVPMKDEGICKGLYLRSWYLLATRGTPTKQWILENLDKGQIVILKGVALQETIYKKDPPVRPADDLDILVPREVAFPAMKKLAEDGFESPAWLAIESSLRLRNGMNFYKNAQSIDVHWHIFPVSRDPEFTNRLFARSSPSAAGYLLLSGTDSFLHTLVHGFGLNQIAPIRWVLDAAEISNSGDVDWDLFWQEVDSTGLKRLVLSQLTVLRGFGVLVPEPSTALRRVPFALLATEKLLTTESLWGKRILRLVGHDFAVWAQNHGEVPSLTNYLKFFPRWFQATLVEWREFKEKHAQSLS